MAYEYSYGDCKPPAKVVINGNDIPVINKGITSRARIDGPTDINRLTEVYFPAEWEGHDISKAVKALDLNGSDVWEPVDIKLYDPELDNYFTYHRGFPLGFAGGSNGTIERKLRIGDPAQLLSGIPFSGSYNYSATVGDVISDFVDEFQEQQDVFNVTGVTSVEEDLWQKKKNLVSLYKAWENNSIKSFKKNKHTLQDVMDYITGKINGELFFIPTGSTPGDIALIHLDQGQEFYAENADGSNGNASPKVVKNNALYEIQPVNTIEVNGQTHKGPADKIGNVIQRETGEYPYAKAVHEPLKRLAGNEYKTPIQNGEAISEGDAEDEAVEALIDQIEGGGTGEIVTQLFPLITPHDNIYTKPACGSNVAQDLPDIGYTVNEVTHRVGFDTELNSFFQKTHLRVNTHISRDDITVTSTIKQI